MGVQQHSTSSGGVAELAMPTWSFTGSGLVVEVLGVYARVRWLTVRRGPVEAVSVLREGLREHALDDRDGLLVLRSLLFGRAVTRVLGYLPTDNRCLMRSLVITAMLARRGVFAKVVIGARPSPSFAAHAWVEVNGTPLLPGDDASYARFVEV